MIRQAFAEKTLESHRLAAQLDRATAAAARVQAVTSCQGRLSTPTALLAIQIQSATARYLIGGSSISAPPAIDALTALLDQQDAAIRARDHGLQVLSAGGTPDECQPPAQSPNGPR